MKLDNVLVEVSEGRFYNMRHVQAISPPVEEESHPAHLWLVNGESYELSKEEYEKLISTLRNRESRKSWWGRLVRF